MNKIYLLLLFALVCSLLPAQTDDNGLHGIFDLSFGMMREQAITTLTNQGFKYGSGQTSIYCMFPTPADTLDGMRATLYFYGPDETLSAWDVRFPVLEDPELEQNVIQVLTDLHGEGIEIATGTEHRFLLWFPDDYHKISASYSAGDGFFWVIYSQQKDEDEEDDEDWDY